MEGDTNFVTCVGIVARKDIRMFILWVSKFSSYDKAALDLTRRHIDSDNTSTGLFVVDGISDFESFSFLAKDAEFVEIHLAVYCEYPLGTDIGIFQNRERKSSYGIGRYSRNIHERCHKKSARLDENTCYQCFFDDTQRTFFVFRRSLATAREYASNDSKEDHESQCEIREVFHHIPKFP